MRSRQSNTRNRSNVFKQFLKCLSKPGKIERDKMPSAKQLLAQREYVDYERKKEVQCEIIPIDIKSANNDSLKCLVFKIGKADPNNKKNNGGGDGKMMNGTDIIGDGLQGIEGPQQYYRGGGEKSKNGLEYLKKDSENSETTGKNAEEVLIENDSQDSNKPRFPHAQQNIPVIAEKKTIASGDAMQTLESHRQADSKVNSGRG